MIERTYVLYNLSPQDEKRLHQWRYHPPKEGYKQTERYNHLTEVTKKLAEMIMCYCPPGRQTQLALTKLEECRMWANNAIAVGEHE